MLKYEKQMSLPKDRIDYTLVASPLPTEFMQQDCQGLAELQRQMHYRGKSQGLHFLREQREAAEWIEKDRRYLACARKQEHRARCPTPILQVSFLDQHSHRRNLIPKQPFRPWHSCFPKRAVSLECVQEQNGFLGIKDLIHIKSKVYNWEELRFGASFSPFCNLFLVC